MKDVFLYLSGVVVFIIVVFAVVYVFRLFSNVATPITVHEVEPGVHCATMVTDDGAAIDCWHVQ